MQTKYKKLKVSHLDKYIEVQEYFGWEVVDQEAIRSDEKVRVTFQRDKAKITDYKTVRRLEKQYYGILKPIPVTLLIFLVLGTGFLLTFLFTKDLLFFAYGFMYNSLTCYCIATYALIVYLLILCRRKKLLATLLHQASVKTGTNKDWPTRHNIYPEQETSWALGQLANR